MTAHRIHLVYDAGKQKVSPSAQFAGIRSSVDATKPIPVRLPDEFIARLDKVALKIHVRRATIIRFCVETWVAHFEDVGKAALPPDWERIIARQDGRRRESIHPKPDTPTALAAYPTSRSALGKTVAAVMKHVVNATKHPSTRERHEKRPHDAGENPE